MTGGNFSTDSLVVFHFSPIVCFVNEWTVAKRHTREKKRAAATRRGRKLLCLNWIAKLAAKTFSFSVWCDSRSSSFEDIKPSGDFKLMFTSQRCLHFASLPAVCSQFSDWARSTVDCDCDKHPEKKKFSCYCSGLHFALEQIKKTVYRCLRCLSCCSPSRARLRPSREMSSQQIICKCGLEGKWDLIESACELTARVIRACESQWFRLLSAIVLDFVSRFFGQLRWSFSWTRSSFSFCSLNSFASQ